MKYILILLLISSLIACDKNDDDSPQEPVSQLPPETTTGENTFGCLINGEPFVVRNTSNQVAIFQNGGLFIGGQLTSNGFLDNVNMFISESNIGAPIMENSIYQLNSDTIPKGEYFSERLNCRFNTSTNYSGSIEILKLDTVNYIISGKFHFQANSNSCTEIINVTEGRFDLQYIP
ncbi:DUF6252 family protein [Nonlabens sp. Asnod2-A12]|uniref:DUF6252 family protein n=1 Tax=Nonlabens sp. Asnod2-A12 TaxID=3160578 RepID=UPI00386A6A84